MSELAEVIQQAEEKFTAVAPERMAYAKEAGFAVQVLENNSYLAKAARECPQSLKRAVVNIAAIGLTLNPAEKYAYLIPRNVKVGHNQWQTKVFLEPSYMGLCKLATDSGVIEWIQARAVYRNDNFVDKGLGELPEHTFNAFKERGDFVGVYCTAKLKSGDYLSEIMTEEEINAIRDKSESWKKNKSGPWADFYLEQAKKTVVRRAYKMWPRSDGMERLAQAVDLSNENEGFEQIVSAPEVKDFTGWQKTYFDQLIENNDALGMYVFKQSMCGNDASGSGASVFISLTNSFPKGEKGKYQTLVNELTKQGENQYQDISSTLEAYASNGDDLGLNETLDDLSQEVIDYIAETGSDDLRMFIKEIREAA